MFSVYSSLYRRKRIQSMFTSYITKSALGYYILNFYQDLFSLFHLVSCTGTYMNGTNVLLSIHDNIICIALPLYCYMAHLIERCSVHLHLIS